MHAKADLIALRYFLAVAETGSYSKAASSLRLTQPAVSRQIQYLERSYNTRLFRREGRRFEVTETGTQLVFEATAILDRFDALEGVIGEASREPSGTLNIGATWAVGESLLPPAIAKFRAKYPKVFVHVMQDSSDRLADALVERKLDIAVLYHRPRENELDFVPLMEVELGLISGTGKRPRTGAELPAGKALTLSQVSRLPLILPARGQVLRDLIEANCARQRIAPNIVMESDSLPLSKSLVVAGQGYTILALGGVYEEVQRRDLRFIPITSPPIPWRMYAATCKERTKTLAVEAMSRELSAFIRSSATGRRWKGHIFA